MLSFAERERMRRPGRETVRLGVIAAITDEGLYQVQFDGASAASGKGYPAIKTGNVISEGDRVACMRVRGSYIILGAY